MDVLILLSEKITYFVIAFAIYLLGKCFYFYDSTPPVYLLFNSSIAISILCGNIPKVLPVPQEYYAPLHKIDRFCFGVALMSLVIIMGYGS